jgi:hypothetical protein
LGEVQIGGRNKKFWGKEFLLAGWKPQSDFSDGGRTKIQKEKDVPLPQPSRARATQRNSLDDFALLFSVY